MDQPLPHHVHPTSRTARRGKLKIYLGMAAGVGKTYQMLSDAINLKQSGHDIVAGYIEPHDREETEALAKLLPSIPHKIVTDSSLKGNEFDLDSALERKPAIILVDELAHSNPSGYRHAKRWQDIEELLNHGIDVYTTVNVQHLESLNDLIAKITTVVVQETIPDAFFSSADSVELIDIPPEELRARISDGKVYQHEKISTALSNFFTQGNLIALREIALRATAVRVDAEMRSYRHQHAIKKQWPTTPRVMVCIGPNPMASNLVRAAHRIAQNLHAELLTLFVESSSSSQLGASILAQAQQALQLSEELGARSITTSSDNLTAAIIQTAREHDVTLIVLGKAVKPRWRNYVFTSLVDDVIRKSGDIDVYVITNQLPKQKNSRSPSATPAISGKGVSIALLTISAITLVGTQLRPMLEPAELSMGYLLGVAWIASRFTLKEAILACLTCTLAFDFFFVPPYYTFAVANLRYGITLFVMLVITGMISSLALRLRAQSQLTADRERRTNSLFKLSSQLAGASSFAEICRISQRALKEAFTADAAVIIRDEHGTITARESSQLRYEETAHEAAVIDWVVENSQQAGAGTDTLPGAQGFYTPLTTKEGCLGVVALFLEQQTLDLVKRTFLDACIGQICNALERVQAEISSQRQAFKFESERIRSSLLSAVSHDIRTPLASISGAAHVMREGEALSDDKRTDLLNMIIQESARLTKLTKNVLDITRLESEAVTLNTDWCSLEELIGSSLSRTEDLLRDFEVKITIPGDLPLIRADGVLVEQLFINIIENSVRYAPPGSTISISAEVEQNHIKMRIADQGPGFPSGTETQIFNRPQNDFQQGIHGFGLGLSICRAIVSTHSGSISAKNNSGGGATIEILFPIPNESVSVPHE